MVANPEVDLVQLFARAGYPRAYAGLLHPADIFIDLSGEDIRRRMYLTQDADGNELCLRPEFTIPLCLAAVRAGNAAGHAMSYFGPVFRHRPGESGEFIQAGVESLGRSDAAAADAETVALAIEAARTLGLAEPTVRLGDVGLLDAVLRELGATPSFSRRLKRRLAAGKPGFLKAPDVSSTGVDRYGGVLAALEGAGPEAARAFVTDMLNMTGVQVSGGRSVGEIAERFLARAQGGQGDLPPEKAAVLERFLALEGEPDQVCESIRTLAQEANLNLANALELYETRIGFVAAGGVNLARVLAQTRFVRSLDYYTGMTFEITHPALASGKPLVGGGRYDQLLARLGAQAPVNAVGFSVWVERFQGAGVLKDPADTELERAQP